MQRLVLVTLWLAATAAWAAPKHSSVPSETAAASAVSSGVERLPVVVKGERIVHPVIAKTAQDQAAEKSKEENDAALTYWTKALAILTFVLAATAIAQAYLFIRQLKVTQRALNDSKKAADAAKASADALPKIERAYIFAKVQLNRSFNLVSQTMRYDTLVQVNLKNLGKTPAVIKRLRAYAYVDKVPPTQLINHEKEDRTIPKGIVIAAGDEHVELVNISLDSEQFVGILDIVERIYCVGLVDYEDVLGATRTTKFCWQSYPMHNEILFTIAPVDELNNFT